MMSDFLTRGEFLKKRDRARKVVELPELGGKVIVQAPSALERGLIEAWLQNKSGGTRTERVARLREKVAITCCIDESGTKMFAESDIDLLGQMPAVVLERILRAYQELSLTDDVDLEILAGNSEATHAAALP